MPADTYGAVRFGLTDETGFYIDSVSIDFSAQEVWTSDAQGDDVAGAVFKHEGTFSLEGAVKTEGDPTWTLGTALVIASFVEARLEEFLPGYAAATDTALNIITGANISLASEQLEMTTISGVIKPYMGAKNV